MLFDTWLETGIFVGREDTVVKLLCRGRRKLNAVEIWQLCYHINNNKFTAKVECLFHRVNF